MLTYPNINPIAFHLGPLNVHWYGLMYLIGFLGAWLLLTWRAKKPNSGWTQEQVSDVIFYTALGVVLGGRLGYMLFYDTSSFIHDPFLFFKLWQGGMSFHGGLIGVLIAIACFGWRYKKSFVTVGDFIVPVVPLGLAAGRVGNFINGELWGVPSSLPWSMVFPSGGVMPRQPSQLYEFALEGVALFFILWIYSAKPRAPWAVSGLFLFLYGSFRFFCECFREPDPQLGYLAWHWLTMGQLLSLPMIAIGLFLFIRAKKSKNNGAHHATVS